MLDIAECIYCGFLSHFPVFLPLFHFLSFSRIIPISLFTCLSRVNLKQTILEKTSWIMLLIMIFLGSHGLKILFIHMYIHTTRILSPFQGKAGSLQMFKPFVQGRLWESCCVFPHTAAGWFQHSSVCENERSSFHHCVSDCTVLSCQQEEVLASCIWEIWGETFPKENTDRLLIF